MDVEESYGLCKRRKCKNIGVLGDGLCVACWDKRCIDAV